MDKSTMKKHLLLTHVFLAGLAKICFVAWLKENIGFLVDSSKMRTHISNSIVGRYIE